MKSNIKLLHYIHQNAQMGLIAIEQLFGIVEEDHLKKVLQSQNEEYKKIYDECEKRLGEKGKEAKETSPFTKIFSYITININTLTDKSPSRISELMIRGSTMGVIDITKKIKEYNGADKEILNLADQLLKAEQSNIDELKNFL
ncbi:hypothetical protein [Heyndrickxia acidicola]|uniref:DUF2383 domain-containing protein n=1 Tax=Heyndrickxia acidicola TaxID=209389 RepID=A0ABU6MRN8_9BACI|nr:hypothetical protein [Heyndrickxia acidicola]MED1205710.1 hypothetical protein [Heyndrickxia acidicola]